MNDIQLMIAFKQAHIDETQELEEKADFIIRFMEFLKNRFDNLNMFTNPEMYQRWIEMKDIMKHREDINEENFQEVWDEVMEEFPAAFVVEEPEPDDSQAFPSFTPDIEQHIAGIMMKPIMEDGEPNGDE